MSAREITRAPQMVQPAPPRLAQGDAALAAVIELFDESTRTGLDQQRAFRRFVRRLWAQRRPAVLMPFLAVGGVTIAVVLAIVIRTQSDGPDGPTARAARPAPASASPFVRAPIPATLVRAARLTLGAPPLIGEGETELADGTRIRV